jgi:serine/threonine protein kinase
MQLPYTTNSRRAVVPLRLMGRLGQAHAPLKVESQKNISKTAMQRAAQLAEDKRAPPGYRTVAVLTENLTGRSLRVKWFGGQNEEWYGREIVFRRLGLHDSMREQLADEARVIGKLNHQNVVRFEGLVWSEDRSTFFLLSHWCPGGSLLDKFNAVRARASCKENSEDMGMPNAFVRACMQQVLDAIEHMHVELGISHNVVKMESGVHAIVYFAHQRENRIRCTHTHTHTHTHTCMYV